jgi:quercetin dioxygenase-like cupin family protein
LVKYDLVLHPHEQVSSAAAGEVIFFLDGEPTQLGPGDMFTVPPDVPHTVQVLTSHVRLVDTFTPLHSITPEFKKMFRC